MGSNPLTLEVLDPRRRRMMPPFVSNDGDYPVITSSTRNRMSVEPQPQNFDPQVQMGRMATPTVNEVMEAAPIRGRMAASTTQENLPIINTSPRDVVETQTGNRMLSAEDIVYDKFRRPTPSQEEFERLQQQGPKKGGNRFWKFLDAIAQYGPIAGASVLKNPEEWEEHQLRRKIGRLGTQAERENQLLQEEFQREQGAANLTGRLRTGAPTFPAQMKQEAQLDREARTRETERYHRTETERKAAADKARADAKKLDNLRRIWEKDGFSTPEQKAEFAELSGVSGALKDAYLSGDATEDVDYQGNMIIKHKRTNRSELVRDADGKPVRSFKAKQLESLDRYRDATVDVANRRAATGERNTALRADELEAEWARVDNAEFSREQNTQSRIAKMEDQANKIKADLAYMNANPDEYPEHYRNALWAREEAIRAEAKRLREGMQAKPTRQGRTSSTPTKHKEGQNVNGYIYRGINPATGKARWERAQ